MVEKIVNNTTPYGKIRASHEGSLHSSTLSGLSNTLHPAFTSEAIILTISLVSRFLPRETIWLTYINFSPRHIVQL